MKNQIKNALILLITLFTISCTKEEEITTNAGSSSAQLLVKTTFWNSTTGVESTFEEATYDSKGILESFKSGGNTTTAEYNANGTIAKFLVKAANYPVNSQVFELTYANNKVSKIVITYYQQTGAVGNTQTRNYEYNAAGKISKLNILDSSKPTDTYVYNYTWTGDNLTKKEYLYNGTVASSQEYTYDDKKNPYFEGGVYMDYIYSRNLDPISKNNRLTVKSSFGTQTTTYTYNDAGYPTSAKQTAAEGIKYYYK
jgi:YD repeat-containing protein